MISFLDLFRQYIEYCRSTNDRDQQKKSVTIEAYVDKYNLIALYLSEKKQIKLKANKFSMVIAQDIWESLNPKYSQNYSIRIISICSNVLNYGVFKGIIKFNSIINFKKKRSRPKPPPYFSSEQILLFEHYISDKPMKQKACDMFVIQLHTGFDYGDFGEFNEQYFINYLGERYIIKPRNKNGNTQVIPVSGKLSELLEKYNNNIKLLSNVQYNKNIKLVADDLSIALRIKSKDGRKLFMMNKLNNEGYSMAAVSKMGGHKTIRTTEEYYAQVDISLIHRELALIRR